jgi:hypothetical protein
MIPVSRWPERAILRLLKDLQEPLRGDSTPAEAFDRLAEPSEKELKNDE